MRRYKLKREVCVGPLLLVALFWIGALWAVDTAGPTSQAVNSVIGVDTIRGSVRDASGPVAGAIVRIQTTTHATKTDVYGRFTLSVVGMGEGPFGLTAWATGYYTIGPIESRPGQSNLEFILTAHATEDNPDYQWSPALCPPEPGEGPDCCSACHSHVGSDFYPFLPVDEWLLDAHSQSAVNPRFLSMYTGKPIQRGETITSYQGPKEGLKLTLQQSMSSKPDDGPGFRWDHPDRAGNCATCHVPAAAVSTPLEVDPTKISGVAAEGVTCDFCHKVWAVRLNPSTGLPFEDMPGVLSYEFRRPNEGKQFFAGPFDDIAPGLDTFSLLQKQSQFCAPCHYGGFQGTVIYNSFGEWLDSAYSDPTSTGKKTCQDCHMPTGRTCLFALPEKGGRVRDPATIASHQMPGSLDKRHLQSAASLHMTTQKANGRVFLEVRVKNKGAGHHLPTGIPLRHIMLVVTAKDAQGRSLPQRSGPRLPPWTGDFAGRPGRAYAKLLEELGTRRYPTAAFWRPTRIITDNRLPALQTDVSLYAFEASAEGPIRAEARLIYRRAFQELTAQKGWVVPDILMASTEVVIRDFSSGSNQ
jgi:hypothetical protein